MPEFLRAAGPLEMFAVVSGLLQALGYIFYICVSLKKEKKPNAATWVMFAYGTTVLAVLERDLEANPLFLILPFVCAACSVLVVIYIFWNFDFKKIEWKAEHTLGYVALAIDIMLTVAYVAVKMESDDGGISAHEKHVLMLRFLVLSNASTIVSFLPLVWEVIVDHKNERPLPWFVWGSAYATLASVTLFKSGFDSEFMLYPAMNVVLHIAVGILASRQWFRPKLPLTH